MSGITPIVMPKWGLSMKEGTLVEWLVEEGTEITAGMPIMEVETDKLSNAVEAPDPGLLRKITADEGETLPVKALLGVLADESVSDAEIDEFVASYVTPVEDEDEDASGPAYEYAEVDGIRVRYARKGGEEGTPVVFIHGFGGDLDNWLFNIDAISESHPAIALDLPGHGQSDIKLPGLSIAALAEFVDHFLTSLEVKQAHLVGHSMGAAVSSQMAVSHPERVASLTLIGSAGLGEEINNGYTDTFAKAGSRREMKPALQMLFADASLVSRQLIDDVLKYKRMDGVTELLSELGSALFADGKQKEQPGLQLLEKGPAPKTLVIWGRQDNIIPVAHADTPLAATVEIFDDAGHMAQMERASDVNQLILSHLSG